jgi:GNAT superfamily N-acetyltransferase
MFVVPESRGTGIARRLLEAMETWARDEGYRCFAWRPATGSRRRSCCMRAAAMFRPHPSANTRTTHSPTFYEKGLTP